MFSKVNFDAPDRRREGSKTEARWSEGTYVDLHSHGHILHRLMADVQDMQIT